MRRLLRRLAWLIARLLLIQMLTFCLLAAACRRTPAPRDYASDRIERSGLPLLWNLHPRDLQSRLEDLIVRFSKAPSSEDVNELTRLGGAAFPLLLPELPRLEVTTAKRIAWAVIPVAQRMNWRGAHGIDSDERALAFLIDSWKEHEVDFQPTIAARWVERLAARGSEAMSLAVAEYDTYALPALIAALEGPPSPNEAARTRRLLEALQRLTRLGYQIPDSARPDELQRAVDEWQRWWQLHAPEYTISRGPSRWSAMLTQTQFGQWLNLAVRFRFGTDRDHQPVLDALAARATRSGLLIVAACLGASSAVLARFPWSHSTTRACLAMIPYISLMAAFSLLPLKGSLLAGACVAFLVTTWTSPIRTTELQTDTTNAIGHRSALGQLSRFWQFAGHSWPFLLTFVFVIEKGFEIRGLGQACVEGFRSRDLHQLMGITALTAACLLLVELMAQWGVSKRSTTSHNDGSAS